MVGPSATRRDTVHIDVFFPGGVLSVWISANKAKETAEEMARAAATAQTEFLE